jgi:NADH-quinone oxidoreductase subunit I
MIKYIKDIILGSITLVKGMAIVFKHMFHKPITIQYPEQKLPMSTRFHGRLVMPVDPEKGEHRCTACKVCSKTCPNHSIEIVKQVDETGKPKPRAASYMYNMSSCMFCNLCVEVCPFFAIMMSEEYELAVFDRSELLIDLVSENYKIDGRKGKWWESKFKDEEQAQENI